MTFTYHCNECGDEVDTPEGEVAFCPNHPEAIIDSISSGGKPKQENTKMKAIIREGDQYIGEFSTENAPNDFIRGLVVEAIEDGTAQRPDAEGCIVTATVTE